MALQGNSQNTLKQGDRVSVYVNQVGDTMVEFYLKDARVLLEDVLHYRYSDSLLKQYKEKDSLNIIKIKLKDVKIDMMNEKMSNLEEINSNLNEIIKNKDEELSYKDDTIKQQKKEIRKQKIQKVLGFTGSIVLPIITLLLLI